MRGERPDYAHLKEMFRHLRDELGVEVTRAHKRLPHVPTEAEIRAFWGAVNGSSTRRQIGDLCAWPGRI